MNDMPEKTIDDQQRETVHKFLAPRVTPIYSEGLSQMQVGYPNSRLIFDSSPATASSDGNEVTHHVAAEVVISTIALADMAIRIVEGLLQSRAHIEGFGEMWTAELISKVDALRGQTSTKED